MDLQARLDAVIDGAIAAERIVGSVTMVARNGQLVYGRAAGWFDREAGIPMRRDAIFRLASVTKPMVAATALAMVERNLLGLDHAVSDYLPYFRPRLTDGSEARILIRHLLSHSSGLGYAYADPLISTGMTNTEFGFEETLTRIAAFPLDFAPGTGWVYGVNIDVLGAIVAATHGGTLHDALQHYVTGPLGMSDTGFIVTDESRLAIPYADGKPPRRMQDGELVTDEGGSRVVFDPSRHFNPKAYQSGGGGALGSADDLFRFFETLRVGGGDILRPETVEMAVSNQVGNVPRRPQDAGQRFGFLGAIVDDPAEAQAPYARGTFRWGGVYGHDWSVDPVNGLTILSMTNTALEGCTGRYPKEVRNAVYGVAPPA